MAFETAIKTYSNKAMDLNDYCIKNAPATYFVKVSDIEFPNKEFREGDILVVDRSLNVQNNNWVVMNCDGQLTLKKVLLSQGKIFIVPENPQKIPINITRFSNYEIWGIITFIIRKTI